MICSGLLTLPFMATQTPRLDAFLLIIETALATSSLVVALLLYARFAQSRTPSLLALAGGFLFVTLTTLPQLLRLSQSGLINSQLHFATGLAMPLAVFAYALLRRIEHLADSDGDRAAAFIGRSVAAVFLLAALAIWLAASGDGHSASAEHELSSSVQGVLATGVLVILIGTALGIVWRQRRAALDLWLLVMLTAWVIAVLIQGISPDETRFAWQFAQLYPLLGVGCMLLALVPEEAAPALPQAAIRAAAGHQGNPLVTETTLDAIAHELNQPLCAISANAEAIGRLLPANAPPELREALADIAADAQRMSRAMSTAQRLLAGVNEPPAVIDVAQLVDESLLQLQSELREHAVICEVNTAPHLPGIRGLRQPLVQLMVNLVTNSLEAMSGQNARERRLKVYASRHDSNAVVISVQDSGVGIPPEVAARAFDPYFTTKPHRSGLGLAICRSIADAHGGDIELAPGDGCGTAVRVILPASS